MTLFSKKKFAFSLATIIWAVSNWSFANEEVVTCVASPTHHFSVLENAGRHSVKLTLDSERWFYQPNQVNSSTMPISEFQSFVGRLNGSAKNIADKAGVDLEHVSSVDAHFVLLYDDYLGEGIFIFRDSERKIIGTVLNNGQLYDDGLLACLANG